MARYNVGDIVITRIRTMAPENYKAYYSDELAPYGGLQAIIKRVNDFDITYPFYELEDFPGQWSEDMFDVIQENFDPTIIL